MKTGRTCKEYLEYEYRPAPQVDRAMGYFVGAKRYPSIDLHCRVVDRAKIAQTVRLLVQGESSLPKKWSVVDHTDFEVVIRDINGKETLKREQMLWRDPKGVFGFLGPGSWDLEMSRRFAFDEDMVPSDLMLPPDAIMGESKLGELLRLSLLKPKEGSDVNVKLLFHISYPKREPVNEFMATMGCSGTPWELQVTLPQKPFPKQLAKQVEWTEELEIRVRLKRKLQGNGQSNVAQFRLLQKWLQHYDAIMEVADQESIDQYDDDAERGSMGGY